MFSTSTMASSTSSPMATASPPSVIVLIDMPNQRKTMAVMTIDSGMAVSVMNVVRKFSRKINSTITTRMPPSREGLLDVVHRQVDELLLLVQLGGDADVGRQRRFQFVQGGQHPVGQRPGVGAGLLVDRQQHGRSAGERAVGPLDQGGGVAPFDFGPLDDAGDLAEEHRPAVADLHHQLAEVVDRLDAAQRSDQQFVRPLIVEVSAGDVDVAVAGARFRPRRSVTP